MKGRHYNALSTFLALLLLALSNDRFFHVSAQDQSAEDKNSARDTTTALLPHLSFQPPFDTIGDDGKRLVGPGWSTNGETLVQQSFARLTPDRQSKRVSSTRKCKLFC